MFTKPLTRALRYILIKPFFLAIGWSYLHDLSHTFLKRLKLLWGEIACQNASFSKENSWTSRLSIFYRFLFLTIKTSSRHISITLLQMPLINFTNIEAAIFGKKILWTILEEQFPMPRNTAASEIGNGVISLLWQLRCHCNPVHSNFHLYLIQLWW